VKIKKEIIKLGLSEIQPAEFTAPHVSPRTLKEWLDEKRDLTLLDVRNTYEIHLGAFRGSRHLDIGTFSSLPSRLQDLEGIQLTDPIVTYCTGGIRCEKAAALLLKKGFKEIYQLEGGILKYFEECGEAHYDGECFVYDRRVAVDAQLRETQTVQCFNCIMPVSLQEQQMESYVPDVSCPHCIDGKPIKEENGN